MTLRKKIMLNNFLAVVCPLILIVAIWTVYVNFSGGGRYGLTRQTSSEYGRRSQMLNVIYTYEEEFSEMKWDVAFSESNGRNTAILIPEQERIEELRNLGYHIQAESEDGISFTNIDETDHGILASFSDFTDEGIFWSEKGVLIKDSFWKYGRHWDLTTVFNENRIDKGVRRSMLPVYVVPQGTSAIMLLIALLCMGVTSALFSQNIARAVLVPLRELKKGAGKVAKGDLDYRITYTEKDEYGEVCEEFDHMRIQLKEARGRQEKVEGQRREMLRGISHDLRSPLTSIKGYAQGIKDGIASTEEKRRRYCDAILTRADDMERLTESLSLLVRQGSDLSWLHLETVLVDEYIRQLLEEKDVWLKERKVDVSYSTEAPNAEVNLDIREMQRVFMNLFENTVRYRTAECSKVEIDVRQNRDKAEIRFTDDGPGVSGEHIVNIFETFYRVDESRTTPEKGSGIGLAVVKQIIEGQGGQVSASSENGLCIMMTLPLAKEGATDEKNTDH